MGTPFGVALRAFADAEPGAPSLICEGVTISRAELIGRAERLAAAFAELGVREGTLVTIGLPNSIEFVEAMFAAWFLGATPQPISHRLPPVERSAIVELADPTLAVGVPPEEAGGRPTMDLAAVEAAAGEGPFEPGSAPSTAVAPVWKAVTSGGSTGRPKLIVAVDPGTVEGVAGLAAALQFPEPGAAVLVTGPLSHNAPFAVLTSALLLGNVAVLMPRFDAEETLRLVEAERIRWLYLVPTMMQRISRLPAEVRGRYDVSSLQIAFHMAAPCPPWLKREWIDWLGGDVILELYGGTELQAMTVITGSEWLTHEGSVGRCVIGEMEVRDDHGRPLPPGEVGEIWMRRGADQPSPYKYVGASARTADDGWESLGDMGSMDAEGFVYLSDRKSDMILVGGSNVYPAEVEAALDQHPAVRSSCVIGLPDDDLGSVPHAIVDLLEDVSDDDLRTFLRERLVPYKLPRTFERATEPIRDDAGKVRRSALREARLPRP